MGAFHPGEVAVQVRAGAKVSGWGTAHVPAEIPPVAAEFLRAQRMVALGTVDDHGAVWADVITGRAGFLGAPDQRSITITGRPALVDAQFAEANADGSAGAGAEAGPEGDGVVGGFGRESGLIAIEPWSRKRMRANGWIRRSGDHLVMHTDQVYANCPKYIQTRTIVEGGDEGEREPEGAGGSAASAGTAAAVTSTELSAQQRDLISRADTFFIATRAPGLGVDVSHRGGNPGFVTVAGTTRVTWPEYVGNSMYMTLGNLELDPRSGLLFVDWQTGRTLHLTGRAVTDWDPRRAAAVPGAQRMVDFGLDRVVEVPDGMPLRWSFGEYHRFNPPVPAGRLNSAG
ncbi:MAG TPA: pyridoxamine 5'-phosphate oxidase family protein [Actinocrinis sp.]|nr:pyridoxamine 5'-phosphate oxidase family protein [Actinocrinis sp.]